MTNKNDILVYLRNNLKWVANGIHQQDLETTIRVGKEINILRDTIIFIETNYPENQSKETD